MPNTPKKKVFYQIDEVCERLGLSLLDMSVLVSERKIQLCTAVAGLLVEDGHYEVAVNGDTTPLPDDRSRVQGLVDLKPDDAWFVLRHGSQTIFWLAAEQGCYRRLVSTSEEDRGYRRAYPRQGRRQPQEGHVDGRGAALRLPRREPQAGRR